MLVIVYIVESLQLLIFATYNTPHLIFKIVILLLIALLIGFDDKEKIDWKNRTIFFVVPSLVYLVVVLYYHVTTHLVRYNELLGSAPDYPAISEQIFRITGEFRFVRTVFFSEILIEACSVLLGYMVVTNIKAYKISKRS
ncbi:hypothetical protein SAMN02746064_01815 [Alkalibacter saccharofermentans DSM 14828]|uniref:Uncharacterized protein n=1 Tax=Alkalibacter saccharofermentans DSM 14828 TaxID=1120975 RepID=A0A1M4YMG0_9FIRM|nr:hypothetical protein SAMN02746064_01815 [Alkalibacter saccharofermentans DSM 14828]